MNAARRLCAVPGIVGVMAALAGCSPAVGEAVPRPGDRVEEAELSHVGTTAAAPGPADFTLGGQLTQGGWVRGEVPAGTVSLTLGGAALNVTSEGRFFAAFDRDAGRSETLSARLGDGRVVTRELLISPRAWTIEHVNVARRRGGPTEAFMQLRRPELARINAAREKVTGSEGWRQDFIWPVKGRVSGRFGSQRIYKGEPGSYHSGLDIATGASGTPFVAPADGVVILAADGPFTLEGNLLMLDHGMGLNSAFLHCSELLVKEGDTVRQGQVIGRIGSTGRATGPHLHWSLKWRASRLDPLLFIGGVP